MLLIRSWVSPAETSPEIVEHPRILVPLDGSDLAESALPVARQLAEALDGELVLMRAAIPNEFPVAPAVGSGPGSPAVAGMVVTPEATETRQLVEEAQDYLRQHVPQGGRAEVLIDRPVQAIVDASRDLGASLIVMTTHGRTGVSRALLGSVADGVLRQGRLPLLLLRPPQTPTT
ncbi:MAG: universal stress protein [Chloroflexota bacterium]|nr:universal stress protein [Chloroflexota bacterium]